MITPAKRKKIENIIYKTFKALDPTERNTDYYKELFSSMNDKDFDKFIDSLHEENNYLIFQIVDYEIPVTIKAIEDGANVLKVPLYERIAIPHLSKDPERPMITYEPVPVGYLHLKKMQQCTLKKNSTSTNINKRNKFNQVTGKDKNGRSSDVENCALVALGCDKILQEFMGPRADDSVMKNQMMSAIAKDGYVELNKLTNNIENKTTLKMVDVYLLSMGLKSDLISKSLLLPKTLR